MLLEHKPNVNALDKDGFTALAIACKEGFYDIALALINSGAYINVQVNIFRHLHGSSGNRHGTLLGEHTVVGEEWFSRGSCM